MNFKLINRHGPCIGIRLWKCGQKFIQLWIVPPNYTIEPHSHDDEDIELMYIWGKTTFYREKTPLIIIEEFTPDQNYDIGKCFTVPAGTMHWFKTTTTRLIFINFSEFLPNTKPRSAALDFNKQY